VTGTERVDHADVLVVGAGVIGMAVAWQAASAGLSVVACDPDPGRAASWAAAGMLAPITEASLVEAPGTELRLASARQWPEFAARLHDETGIDVGLRDEGTLAIAFDDDDHRHLEELARVHRLLELESEWLDARDCRSLEPLLSPRIRGGLRVSGDWQVDNRALVTALISAMTARRVDVRRCALRTLTGTEERITGGELEDGSVVSSETVVIAAGPWSPAVVGLPAVARPPVRPVKGDIIRVLGSAEDPILSRSIRAGVRGKDVYLVPRRNGEVVIGASVEEAGFSTAVRAGAVFELLEAAVAVVPAVAELELVESLSRLRPGSPDNLPILGATSVPGLVLATGHYRNGVLLTPITAEAITAVLCGHELPAVAVPFTLARFT
jgi:glycine oxidase